MTYPEEEIKFRLEVGEIVQKHLPRLGEFSEDFYAFIDDIMEWHKKNSGKNERSRIDAEKVGE